MAVAIVSKMLDALGLGNENEEEEDDVYEYTSDREDEEEEIIEDKGFFGRKNKIVSMPQPQSVKMVITQPTSFDQSDEICSYLKERKSIMELR